MPNRDGTGRLGRGQNCNATAKADMAGRGRGRGQRGRGMGNRWGQRRRDNGFYGHMDVQSNF